MTSLQELNKQFDALGMTNIRAAVITRGENKGKFAIIQIITNGQPKEMYMSNTLKGCEDYIRGKLRLPSKIRQEDIKSTRMVNSWIKQNGLGNMIKVASEQKGNKRVYTIYSLDPRVKNKEIYKGSLNQCVDFIKKQTGIKDDVKFTNLKSSMRYVGNRNTQVNRQPMQTQKQMFTGNIPINKQPTQVQNRVSMIKNVDDANRWLQSIGAENKYKFYVLTERNASPQEEKRWLGKGSTIYFTEDNPERYNRRNYHRSIYLMVQIAAQKLKKAMPLCIDDRGEKVVDIQSANRWLQRIGEKNIFRIKKDMWGRTRYAWDDMLVTGVAELDEVNYKYKSLEAIIKHYCDFNNEPLPYM